MKKTLNRVFIDGESGTTGLRIASRLESRKDIELMKIDPALRRDDRERRKFLNEADLAFLCLPDGAARGAVSMIENPRTRVIDASTAHRTEPGWAYGLPELSRAHRAAVQAAKRVAVPGCHATGFIVPAYPLVKEGLLSPDYPFCCASLTGYSGGGKKMIAEYEAPGRPACFDSPRQYALSQMHKHLPEMKAVCGLSFPPAFSPVVSDYYAGMEVTVPVHMRFLQKKLTVLELWSFFRDFYRDSRLISVMPFRGGTGPEGGFMDSGAPAGNDRLELSVCGNDERAALVSRFDNLGKGASGAAVQCMNLMLGFEETAGLTL